MQLNAVLGLGGEALQHPSVNNRCVTFVLKCLICLMQPFAGRLIGPPLMPLIVCLAYCLPLHIIVLYIGLSRQLLVMQLNAV